MIGIEAFARRPSQDDPYMTVVLYNSGKPLSMVELSVYQNNDELARDVQIPLFHFTEVLLIRFKAPSMRMPAENGNAAKDDLFTKTAEARLVVIFRKFAYK